MSGIIRQVAGALLLGTVSTIAQVAKPAEPRTVSQVVDFWVKNTEQLIVPAADAMPESKYSFAPSGGQFSGVRTFAEQVKHLAAANYQLAAATLAEKPPAGTEGLEWILITSVPTQAIEDLRERRDWYACRWMVEVFHDIEKNGCSEEDRRFETAERMEACLAILSVVAVRIFQLRTALDAQPEKPAEQKPE